VTKNSRNNNAKQVEMFKKNPRQTRIFHKFIKTQSTSSAEFSPITTTPTIWKTKKVSIRIERGVLANFTILDNNGILLFQSASSAEFSPINIGGQFRFTKGFNPHRARSSRQ
jgi:hypothetical protein